ncbi:MAG: DNA-processing protein DprA, partial [Pseudomonadota bacterium]|nr:DNA-processing protein DprA [Pseudomonadota bacterium]
CSPRDLIQLGLKPEQADRWHNDAALSRGFEILEDWCQHPNQGVLLAGTAGYPESLNILRDAPIFLWYRGNLSALQQPAIAMVGSRGASASALEWTIDTAAELASAGMAVVSGLALGIDGAAHRGAVSTGATIAVMGTGPDIIYPAKHRSLAASIVEHGLLLSEFSPGTKAQARHFPSRNRIISGLSSATLVVEAGIKSGTMITARMAADQGRDVLAVPGALGNPLSRGPHQLIREGALLVENAQQILEATLSTSMAFQQPHQQPHQKQQQQLPGHIPQQPALTGFTDTAENPSHAQSTNDPATSGAEAPELLTHSDFNPTPVDVIALRSSRPISELLGELLMLELEGWLLQAPGGYCRVR